MSNIKLTLELFNAVIAKPEYKNRPYVDNTYGLIIPAGARYAKNDIIAFARDSKLSGEDLNKTFYNSWNTIKTSSRFELYLDQISHYLSTYGTNFRGEMYIPRTVVELPNVKLKYKVIDALSKSEMIERALDLLRSGMALKSETLTDVLSLVDNLGYTFTGNEGIRNKEAIVMIADRFAVYPESAEEILRYIVFKATGETLLIKNGKTIAALKASSFNPAYVFNKVGYEKMATIFNRYKPLFLAFKPKCGSVINKISKLSKTHHKPMVQNPLNLVTSRKLKKSELHWLDNATPYALFKALSALHNRIEGQTTFAFKVRNGKSYMKDLPTDSANVIIWKKNFSRILKFLKEKFDFSDKLFHIPEKIEYALPTSEKLFVGNIPTGTKFTANKLAAGIYWKNSWGASDLDLSGMNVGGKVGWNSAYRQGQSLFYSGDITNAPNGAVEYLQVKHHLSAPTLVMNNVYSGSAESGYKIVVGKGANVSKDYMMNPNKVWAEIKCNSIQKQTILGMMIPNDDQTVSFMIMNMGAGNAHVSGSSNTTNLATKALFQEWKNPYSFNTLVAELGGTIINTLDDVTEENIDSVVDLTVNALAKDTFTKLFS